jgi:hypothetical protein
VKPTGAGSFTLTRLGWVALIAACLGLFSYPGLAVGAETYSLEDTATVVVLHPDSVAAVADAIAGARSVPSTVAVSNIPTATVGTFALADDERSALGFIVAGVVLVVGCCGVLAGRAVVS